MNKSSHENIAVADLASFVQIIAEAENKDQIYASLAKAANLYIGYTVITIMAYNAETGEVKRLYTNNSTAYPNGGIKGKRDTEWSRHVLVKGRPFIGRTKEDIRDNFEDHDLILGLGLTSVMNIPVRLCGQTIGTINLLRETGAYTAKDLEWGLFLAAQLIGPISIED